MKVKELMEALSKANPEDLVEIYFHTAVGTDQALLPDSEYQLISILAADVNTGWDGVVTINGGQVTGC